MADGDRSEASSRKVSRRPWWHRERLRFEGDRLTFAGRAVADLVREHGPVMAYDTQRVGERIGALGDALRATGQTHRMYYAVKANRFGPIVSAVRDTGVCGIDCCSPGELRLALAAGFSEDEISFTGCSLSDADVAEVAATGVRFNLDSIAAIHKVGRVAPGRAIGLRINPRIGVGASVGLVYSGALPTRFGIYPDRVEEAVQVAATYGLVIEGVHMHVGSGWQGDGLPTFGRAARRLAAVGAELAERSGRPLRYVNVGGGIGTMNAAGSVPIALPGYADAVVSAVRDGLGEGVELCVEPGDFIVNDSGITAATVTEVEDRGGVTFVGLDIGFNANPQAAHYGFVGEVLSAERGPAGPDVGECVVVGNVNEVIDVFNPAARLPEVREGDVLAILTTGAYASAMRSRYCLRETPVELAF